MIDIGHGFPFVLLPGTQGRWEWMRPTVAALSRRCRAISFSAPGEPGSNFGNPDRGFDSFVAQIDDVLDRAGVGEATICGVSLGGFVALRYAALRPARVTALILVSVPAPTWEPDRRIAGYLRAPRLRAPLFVARSPARIWPEICAAFPSWPERLRFTARHLAAVTAAPISPTRMAARVRLTQSHDFRRDCAEICVPTLIVTGEPRLDRIVTVAGTLQYLEAIHGARAVMLPNTGHIGLITHADRFAQVVADFVEQEALSKNDSRRRGIG